MNDDERMRYLLDLDEHLKTINKLKALLVEAGEALQSFPTGLCNKIHEATAQQKESK